MNQVPCNSFCSPTFKFYIKICFGMQLFALYGLLSRTDAKIRPGVSQIFGGRQIVS